VIDQPQRVEKLGDDEQEQDAIEPTSQSSSDTGPFLSLLRIGEKKPDPQPPASASGLDAVPR
jgi:hypothetical protein